MLIIIELIVNQINLGNEEMALRLIPAIPEKSWGDFVNANEDTLLHLAVQKGMIKLAMKLLPFSNPDLINKEDEESALSLAIFYDLGEVVEAILSGTAPVTTNIGSAILNAINKNDLPLVKRLLEKAGRELAIRALSKWKVGGKNALALAAEKNLGEMVDFLVPYFNPESLPKPQEQAPSETLTLSELKESSQMLRGKILDQMEGITTSRENSELINAFRFNYTFRDKIKNSYFPRLHTDIIKFNKMPSKELMALPGFKSDFILGFDSEDFNEKYLEIMNKVLAMKVINGSEAAHMIKFGSNKWRSPRTKALFATLVCNILMDIENFSDFDKIVDLKGEIFESIVKMELKQQIKALASCLDANTPLGKVMWLQRGWTKPDVKSGTLKAAYNKLNALIKEHPEQLEDGELLYHLLTLDLPKDLQQKIIENVLKSPDNTASICLISYIQTERSEEDLNKIIEKCPDNALIDRLFTVKNRILAAEQVKIESSLPVSTSEQKMPEVSTWDEVKVPVGEPDLVQASNLQELEGFNLEEVQVPEGEPPFQFEFNPRVQIPEEYLASAPLSEVVPAQELQDAPPAYVDITHYPELDMSSSVLQLSGLHLLSEEQIAALYDTFSETGEDTIVKSSYPNIEKIARGEMYWEQEALPNEAESSQDKDPVVEVEIESSVIAEDSHVETVSTSEDPSEINQGLSEEEAIEVLSKLPVASGNIFTMFTPIKETTKPKEEKIAAHAP